MEVKTQPPYFFQTLHCKKLKINFVGYKFFANSSLENGYQTKIKFCRGK